MARRTFRSNQSNRPTRLAVLRGFRRALQIQTPAVPQASADDGASTLAQPADRRLAICLGWAAVAFFVLAVTRRGWISDDAFITMRAVDHLVHGRGFVYNAGERVLGFTNPLWALLLTVPYVLVQDPYFTPILASVAVSGLFGALLVFRAARDYRVGALVLVAVCFSRSFVDFSTSGLENPLTHLLLGLFFLEFLNSEQRSPMRLTLFASLLIVNRFDTVLMVFAPLWCTYRRVASTNQRKDIFLGALPAALWFVFAVVYYGFPLPNTAYAKLNAEIPRAEMFRQGAGYLVDALVNDPISIGVITAAVIALWMQRKSINGCFYVLTALGLELLYIVAIGGDFMSGRFLTPAVAASAVVLARLGQNWLDCSAQRWAVAGGLALAIASVAFSPLRDDPLREKRDFPVTRIVNERAWFQDHLALLVNFRPVQWKAYGLYGEGKAAQARGRRVVLFNNVGMFAWGAGPRIHVVDDMALTDPLLARIPFGYRDDWRTGHLPRNIPDGYLDSLERGQNVIRDPCIASYFEHLNRIVRGPLFSLDRWGSIVMLNLPGGMTVRACPERIASKQSEAASPAP